MSEFAVCVRQKGWLRLSICLLCCSDSGALHLNDVSDLGDIDKLVDEPLTVHLGQDAPLVVIPEQDVVMSTVSIFRVFLSTLSLSLHCIGLNKLLHTSADNKEDCAVFSVSRIYLRARPIVS